MTGWPAPPPSSTTAGRLPNSSLHSIDSLAQLTPTFIINIIIVVVFHHHFSSSVHHHRRPSTDVCSSAQKEIETAQKASARGGAKKKKKKKKPENLHFTSRKAVALGSQRARGTFLYGQRKAFYRSDFSILESWIGIGY